MELYFKVGARRKIVLLCCRKIIMVTGCMEHTEGDRRAGNTMNCAWLAAAGFLTIKNPASTKWLMCFNKYQLFVWGVMNKLEPEWQLLQVIMKTACKLWPHLFQVLNDDSWAAVAASFISEHFYFHISKVNVWW